MISISLLTENSENLKNDYLEGLNLRKHPQHLDGKAHALGGIGSEGAAVR